MKIRRSLQHLCGGQEVSEVQNPKMPETNARCASDDERRLPRRRSLGGGETRCTIIIIDCVWISILFSLLKMILTEMLNQGGGGVRGRVGSMQLWAGERGGGGLMGR